MIRSFSILDRKYLQFPLFIYSIKYSAVVPKKQASKDSGNGNSNSKYSLFEILERPYK